MEPDRSCQVTLRGTAKVLPTMKMTSLGAAGATALVILGLMVPLSARVPDLSSSRSSNYTSNANLAVYRDYPHSKVKPCLIGAGGCASAYPTPTLCLVSTERCSPGYRIEIAHAEAR